MILKELSTRNKDVRSKLEEFLTDQKRTDKILNSKLDLIELYSSRAEFRRAAKEVKNIAQIMRKHSEMIDSSERPYFASMRESLESGNLHNFKSKSSNHSNNWDDNLTISEISSVLEKPILGLRSTIIQQMSALQGSQESGQKPFRKAARRLVNSLLLLDEELQAIAELLISANLNHSALNK